MVARQTRQILFMAAGALGVMLGFGVVVWLSSGPGDERAPRNVETGPDSQDATGETVAKKGSGLRDVDLRLLEGLREAVSEESKVAVLDAYARDQGATSSSSALRNAMTLERSSTVRIRAFQVAKELASTEGRPQLTSVLKAAVSNPHEDVRRAGLRACRDNPRYELMQDLLKAVERGDSDRPLAIQALAFMEDETAQQVVLETARSKEVPREQRIQAIALLCRTRLGDGVSYLQQLATGEDRELRECAMEALRVWQAANKDE